MVASMINKSSSNRRRASRVYERVDLFYQKITAPSDYSNPSQHQSDAASFTQYKEGYLPQSSCQEHETLNVNISSTGISYTCQEEFNPGDHILLRVLLLSNMTVISVSCEVVYCKPSNPFENDRYPFVVGVRFVNIRAEDTKLLEQHIRRKKARRYPLQALLVLLMVVAIEMPDLILELLVGGVEFVAVFVI
jgi:Tfp pilus assembly protein PilZ